MPGTHSEQFAEPDVLLKCPFEHGVQLFDPVELANLPGKHLTHVLLPVCKLCMPATHILHAVAVAPENIPATQLVQFDVPVLLWNLPAGQEMHNFSTTPKSSCTVVINFPAGHPSHAVLAAFGFLFAGHSLQLSIELFLNCVSPHFTHSPSPN